MLNAERALASLEKSGEALTGILEENANIERPTSNAERNRKMRTSNIEHRTPNGRKSKRERKRLQSVPFASSVRRSAFDVECSTFAFCSSDVRCSYQSFCESVFAHFVSVTCSWILHPPLQASCIRSADDFMKRQMHRRLMTERRGR